MIYAIGERRVEVKGEFWVADSAQVMGSVVLGHNVSVWFNAVIRADMDTITIGDNTNIQDGAVLHVDADTPLTIGEGVTVGHKAMLHGCTVGDNSLIGINAVVLNNVKIGKNCLIGANALVPEGMEIPDNSLVLGSPAKVVKQISEAQEKLFQLSAMHYVAQSQFYKTHLTVDERFE